MKIAWLFNLDADRELERPVGYTPQAKDLTRLEAVVERVDALLLEGDERLIGDGRLGRDYLGRAWCPTPRALRLLERAGVELDLEPPFEVVRRVNHRGFCASLGQPLRGASFVEEFDTLQDLIAQPSESGQWLIKRPYSFAGTGRRRVRSGPLSPGDASWARASLRHDGVQVEPWVVRRADYCVHGYLDPDGPVAVGAPCVQQCNDTGVWLSTRRAHDGELTSAQHHDLMGEAARVASALADAGYFGPFGLDAFAYDTALGLRFNPRSEINARYTMGWAIGMGPERPDRVRRSERSA